MLRPYDLDYDPSNSSHSVFTATLTRRGPIEELQPLAFPTQGEAMHNYNNLVEGGWKQDAPGQPWYGYLRKGPDEPFGEDAVKITINQHIMVKR